MKGRPKPKIERNNFDNLIEGIGIVGLLALIGLLIYYYPKLPAEIPQHYNFKGEVDIYGGKSTLIILCGIALTLYAGLLLAGRYPHKYNYLVEITEQNAQRQYSLAVKMMRMLRVTITWLFVFLCWNIIDDALVGDDRLHPWFLPVFLLTTFGPLAYYLLKAFQKAPATK